MIIAILAVIIFTLLLFVTVKYKGRLFSPSSWMIFIYWVSALNTIPCIITGGIEITDFSLLYNSKYILPSLWFYFLLALFFYPFLHFNECKSEQIELPNEKILGLFSTFIIVVSCFSILYFLPTAISVFGMGDLGAARNERYQFDMEYIEGGMLNTIASVASSFYEFAIMLLFIYIIKGGNKKRCILLFISSFSNIIHVLAYVGRDGVIFWLFSFIFEFLLFYPFLKKMTRKIIIYTFLILGVIIMIPFIMISSGRFGDFILLALTDYMGQPLLNGPLYFGIDASYRPHNYGDRFPLFWQMIGEPEPERIGWEMEGTASWVFGTFVTNFEENLGTFGSILVCIGMGIFFLHAFHRSQKIFPFYKLFIYILYFQIFSQGVFYFRQYTRGGNLYIVISFLFAALFKIIQKGIQPELISIPEDKEKEDIKETEVLTAKSIN